MPLFQTVSSAVSDIGSHFPTHGFTFQDMQGKETFFSFPSIGDTTARRVAALQKLGLRKGDTAGLILIEPEEFVLTFLAMLRAGIVPVPLYPPMSMGNLDAYNARTSRVLNNAGARVLVVSARIQTLMYNLVDRVPKLQKLINAQDLLVDAGAPDLPAITPDDIAFLQYTSGSTSDPKGVIVTHASLVANVTGVVEHGLKMVPSKGDSAVSWLPLYHDMGLIGFVIAPIMYGISTCYIPTIRFIKKPQVWMEACSRHKAKTTFAPNFALALAARKATPEYLAGLDLSNLTALGCGAEPIHPDTMREFVRAFAPAKLPDHAILPAYGMAEATLAIALKPLGTLPVTQVVHAETFQNDALCAPPVDGEPTIEHVSCGVPFPLHEVVAVSATDDALPEGQEGELCTRGPSITPGYFKNPDATAAAFRGGWLHTGDLGFVLDGQVYVTGRLKDLIILNGRNIAPQSVEWAAQSVEGVRKGNVIAFSRPGAHSEELVIALESRSADTRAVQAEVKRVVLRELAVSVTEVVCLPPSTLPKTSSGKLQRAKARQQYLAGRIGQEGSRAAGATDRIALARHMAKGMWSRAKAAIRFT